MLQHSALDIEISSPDRHHEGTSEKGESGPSQDGLTDGTKNRGALPKASSSSMLISQGPRQLQEEKESLAPISFKQTGIELANDDTIHRYDAHIVAQRKVNNCEGNENEGRRTSSKRRRAADEFHLWISENLDPYEKDIGTSSAKAGSPAEAVSASASKRLNKKGKPMTGPAIAKAERERARRERLNEFFEELSRLCDPSGKTGKTDRLSIVADAIKVVQQLRVENNQLRQLNKFFEERCRHLEMSRAQTLYQQTLTGGFSSIMNESLPTLQHGGQSGVEGEKGLQQVVVSVPQDSSFVSQMSSGKTMNTSSPSDQQAAVEAMNMPNAPVTGWLPAPDVCEDQKLRPPAA